MFNIIKQIEYWQTTADNDIITAVVLIDNNRLIEGLFFCHLSIEKGIKAHVVKATNTIPPKSHDLFYLADKACIELTDDQIEFMQILMKYQLEGRYPEFYPAIPSVEKAKEYLTKTKELLSCLKLMQ